MVPVLMMIRRGISARDSLTTVAANAVSKKPKMLPSAPKGLQDWQYVSGAHPYKAVRFSCLRALVISVVTRSPLCRSKVEA